MKSFTLFALLTLIVIILQGQNVAVNNDGSPPNPSALLDIKSNTKGVLFPRMTTAEINSIVNPAAGLMVFNSTTMQLWFNLGTPATPLWEPLSFNTAWGLSGNTGTNIPGNFLGTSDDAPLSFRINNLFSGVLSKSNTLFGYQAAPNISLLTGITAVGDSALYTLFSGNRNTAVGSRTLKATTVGSQNSAFGYQSLYKNENGFRNTGVGDQSLFSNIDGLNNSALGFQALYTNVGGDGNSAIGNEALYANSSGNRNVAFGAKASRSNIDGGGIIAIGSYALYNNTQSSQVAIGDSAMYNNTTGSNNTAMGTRALFNNTVQFNNTAVGYEALYSNGLPGGNLNNTALGFQALRANTGSRNTAVGSGALISNAGALYNTAVGGSALSANTTGYYNTAVGTDALNSNTTGSSNTAVGNDANVTSNNLSNASAFGAGALVSSNNTISFGNGNVDRWAFGITTTTAQHALEVGNAATNGNGAYLTQGGTWTNTSSRYKKENFSNVNGYDLIQKVKSLRIQKWKYIGTNEYHIGPTSEQFYKLFNVGANDKGISTVDPAGIALAAIQEQQKIIEKQHAQINQLQQITEELKKQMGSLKQIILSKQ